MPSRLNKLKPSRRSDRRNNTSYGCSSRSSLELLQALAPIHLAPERPTD
jgi:hypothetical protein